jgi:hypothetical protein
MWVHPGIAEPPVDGGVDGAVDGEVDDDPPDVEPPDDEPLDADGAVVAEPPEPLDAAGAVVELPLVAAVAEPAVNSVAPTAPPARSEPTMPAAATAFRVRFILSPSTPCAAPVRGETQHPARTSSRRGPSLGSCGVFAPVPQSRPPPRRHGHEMTWNRNVAGRLVTASDAMGQRRSPD